MFSNMSSGITYCSTINEQSVCQSQIRTTDQAIEIPLYRITTLQELSAISMIHRCIGKSSYGMLSDQCKVSVFYNIRSLAGAVIKNATNSSNSWTGAETLVRLAKLCLCQSCSQTQLFDVVAAWRKELDTLANVVEVEMVDSPVESESEDKAASSGVMAMASIGGVRSLLSASVARLWSWPEAVCHPEL
ncbi:hypothetical protein D6D12_04506 [Aureobasidium pullulans]|uniref:Uncharacterized protein n=2 Tax=Aureobasidium pullulans TaxID=5580 RepID=A0AB74JUV6_AURPU|nr:hypothetical protein D6D12_04506 [Aureobasidium pullulans]